MTILYLDNEDEVKETNNFTERGEGGGYIIHELAGRNGDYFLPYNRVLPYSMVGDELQDFILNTNNSRIVPLAQVGNRAGSKKSKKKKRKHKSKKKRSKKKISKKRRYKKKSKKR